MLDLITSSRTGRLSIAKFWANVACAAATYKFLSGPVSDSAWLIYLGTVGGFAAAISWMSNKRKKDES